jgi:Polyketide cyclase / dehydrase and lipid transport
LKPQLQSKQEVTIKASLENVWEFNQDLTKIAEYHPRVDKVDLISNKSFREAGVAYQCHLSDGKNTCIEKDIEVVPMQRIVTILPEDTMGITKLLPDYIVETLFTKLDKRSTKMEFYHFYSTKSVKAKVLNLIVRRRIAQESQDTLNAIKKAIEDKYAISSTK